MKKTVKVKRKKFNLIKFCLIFLVLYLFSYGLYYLCKYPIKNIYIIPDSPYFSQLVSDQVVLEQAKIDNYPSFFLTANKIIKKRLLKNPHIKAVTIKKQWLGKMYIYIEEQPKLFYDLNKKEMVLGDQTKLPLDPKVKQLPLLINYVPDTIFDNFCEKMLLLSTEMRVKISEIQYKPNEVDTNRFLLMMDDGNYVYITLNTFTKINQYNNILAQLGKQNGILYLDAGNYFEIFD